MLGDKLLYQGTSRPVGVCVTKRHGHVMRAGSFWETSIHVVDVILRRSACDEGVILCAHIVAVHYCSDK